MHSVTCDGHFRLRDKDGGHTIRYVIAENSMLHANFMALCFIEAELLLREVLHCGNRDFSYRLTCDLDLDLMTFIYELYPYSLEIHRMCENELFTSRLSKVIVLQTYTKLYTTPLRGWSKQCESMAVYVTRL